ncbi:hypothetical protein F2P81_008529 [Scophthalmus maximus]|uniref:Uncharacterized protein n=1 Tax=Scophthalmus maximus TaxID=52904 RepID=A0A6A4TAW3_SCOMX|nr:hypothetical protein F2P81_008529 [Scophthalmus maximus]
MTTAASGLRLLSAACRHRANVSSHQLRHRSAPPLSTVHDEHLRREDQRGADTQTRFKALFMYSKTLSGMAVHIIYTVFT